MYIELSTNEVADILEDHKVMGSCDGSFKACLTLAEYLEEFESATGEPLKLDPIALRCEWDYQTLDYIREQYFDDDIDTELDVVSKAEETLELSENNTTCVHVQNDEYIYIQF